MKIRILYSILTLGSIIGNISADKSKRHSMDDEPKGKAFLIQFSGNASVCDDLMRKGIPHTHTINRERIRSWIQYPRPMEDNVMDNVDVVTQLEDGTFSDSKPLNEFDRDGLSNAYDVLEPHKSFANSNLHWIKPRPYGQNELHLVEQLNQDQCVLCKYLLNKFNKQVIIANAQGLPQEVCRQFQKKRAEEIQAKANNNASKTWRQTEREKTRQTSAHK